MGCCFVLFVVDGWCCLSLLLVVAVCCCRCRVLLFCVCVFVECCCRMLLMFVVVGCLLLFSFISNLFVGVVRCRCCVCVVGCCWSLFICVFVVC